MIRTRIQIYFCKRNRENFFQSSNLEFRSFEQKPRARNNTFSDKIKENLLLICPTPLTPGLRPLQTLLLQTIPHPWARRAGLVPGLARGGW